MKNFKSFIQSNEINNQEDDDARRAAERKAKKDKKGVAEGLKSMYHNAVAKHHGRKADAAFDNDDEEGFKKSMDKNISHKLKAGQKIPQVRDAKKFQRGVAEAESHQSKTTMKHISNPNAAEKKAAKDIKPGIAGVRDRLAMLQAAKNRGALKNEDVDLLSNLYDQLDESNQEIFLNQLEEDAEVLLAFAKTIAEE